MKQKIKNENRTRKAGKPAGKRPKTTEKKKP
jgi:hypothetical protein